MPTGIYVRTNKISEETKRKMSEAKKGKILTEKHKRKLSESALKTYKEGRVVWNKGKKRDCAWLIGNKHFSGKKHTEETKEKMRIKQIILMNKPEMKTLFSQRFSGRRNPNWHGGISKECRKRINNYNWKKIRKHVRERDNYTCYKCGLKAKNNHVHHIIPYRICKNDDANNLITLCPKCHKKEENQYLRIGITNYVRKMKIAVEFREKLYLKRFLKNEVSLLNQKK